MDQERALLRPIRLQRDGASGFNSRRGPVEQPQHTATDILRASISAAKLLSIPNTILGHYPFSLDTPPGGLLRYADGDVLPQFVRGASLCLSRPPGSSTSCWR
jgi:hypothetical protein